MEEELEVEERMSEEMGAVDGSSGRYCAFC